MKFLFIHQNFPGQFKHLAPALAAQGHMVRALGVTGTPCPGVALTNYQIQKGNTLGIHPFAQEFETKVIRAEACAREMLKLKQSGFEPDLIVGHPGWGETLFSKEVFPKARLLSYLEFHYGKDKGDTYFDAEFQQSNLAQDMRLRVKNANNLLALDAMDAGLCPTHWQRSVLPRHYQDKVRVIFDGIDTDLVCPNNQAVVELATRAGPNIQLKAGQEVLTFICRNLEPYRGYHSLLRVLPEILKARPYAQVIIVGGNQTSYGAAPPPGADMARNFPQRSQRKTRHGSRSRTFHRQSPLRNVCKNHPNHPLPPLPDLSVRPVLELHRGDECRRTHRGLRHAPRHRIYHPRT